MTEFDPRLRDALDELGGYLADQLAPLLVADSVELLLDYAPELTGEQLRLWAVYQYQIGGGQTTLADLLFHSLKKIQQLEELEIVRDERFVPFLGGVAQAMIERCAPEDQARLAEMVGHLRETVRQTGPRVDHLHLATVRPVAQPVARAPAAAGAAPALSSAELRDVRRFSLLLERALGGNVTGDVAEQLMVLAASGARSSQELDARLQQMRSAGIGPAVERDLVRSLVGSVPDWALTTGSGVRAPESHSLEAVRRAVQLAGDGARSGERWKELLRVAAEEFNRGAMGRAVTLVDLADRMVRDGEVESRFAEIAKAKAHEAYDTMALLQSTTEPGRLPTLRRLLEFHPGWAVRELLDELVFQPDQKRRRLVLALLEIWGADARQAVIDRLATSLADAGRDPNLWWFQRNLVYLLHRIPRPASADVRAEIDLIAPFTLLAVAPSFQKEAFTLLAQTREEHAAALLARRLTEAERALESAVPPPHPVPEVWKIMNALAVALARSGSSFARRALVEHALARRARSGETLARLRELGRFDLSADAATLDRLVGALRELVPRRVLGFVVGRHLDEATNVARALVSTRAPEVRRLLAEFVERFPDRETASAAEAGAEPDPALAEIGPSPPSSVQKDPSRTSLSGDLEVFGLPGLLQSLQQSASSGRLLLRDGEGQDIATVDLWRGRVADCRRGRLSGSEAFFQLFEEALARSFEFSRATVEGAQPAELSEVMGLLMEAMRRYDELQRVGTLVPDHAYLHAGTERPTVPTNESDGEMVRQIWARVRSGTTTRDCEESVAADSFRVRTLLAHWLEEGALIADVDQR